MAIDSHTGVGSQIPRLSLALLMLTQAVVVVPHGAHLSWWVIVVGLACAAWRWMVFQGRWGFPSRWIKVLLVTMAAIGVGLDVRLRALSAFSLETATALLIVAFALKLVETRSRRDAYVVIFLSYFVIATEFLFEQTMAIAAYELLAVVLVTAAMVGLNQMHTRIRPLVSLRIAATLVLQAAPLMLVLFLFFPRMAPLWSVPLPGGAQTGITDRVTPGDIAVLTQSDEIAFRVVFDGPIPHPRALYWRGIVYSRYDRGTWSVGPQPTAAHEPPLQLDIGTSTPRRYEVLLEPTQGVWLFALETPVPVSPGVELTRDYRLVADEPVRSLFRYRVDSFADYVADRSLPDWLERRETQIARGVNPRAVRFAAELAARYPNKRDYLDALLERIRVEPYRYTLNPPRLSSDDDIDEFWFDTRAGFCSHYAAAFVYLARLAGIPARMVGGYQGGEINPLTGHIVVRQYDAHAWAEVWLEDAGWVRMDPTAAVAPQRIEQGLDAALSEPDRATLSALTALRFGGSKIADLMYWFESLEHRWNVWVVGYDSDRQYHYLRQLLGGVSPVKIGLVMLAGGAVSLALVALSLFWRRRTQSGHPLERTFRHFGKALGRHGMPRAPEESPRAFLARVAQWLDKPASDLMPLVESLEALLYNPMPDQSRHQRRFVERGLRRLRLEAALRNRN